jgi:hypothetical protein
VRSNRLVQRGGARGRSDRHSELARPRAARSWQPSGPGLDCDIAPPAVAKSRCCSAQSRWVRPRQEVRSDGQPRTTLRRVAIDGHHPRPIVPLHGRSPPPHRRDLAPAQPNHLGGCGTAHRGWCGGSGAAGSGERPNPDADCKWLRFAHAGRTKSHPRRPKPHGRQHQPDALALGGADRIDSIPHPDRERRRPRLRSPRHRAPARPLPPLKPRARPNDRRRHRPVRLELFRSVRS